MAARAIVSFLMLAAVWILGIPGQVHLDDRVGLREHPEPGGPTTHAEAMGLQAGSVEPSLEQPLGVDPTPHRAAIDRIESVLYRRAPTDFGDAGAVSSGVHRLAETVLEAGRTPDPATAAGDGAASRIHRQAGLVLFDFARQVDARADVGYTLPSLVSLRREWETVRAAVFRPADWMRSSSRALDLLQEPPPAVMDPRTDEAIQHAESELRRLMVRGRRTAERLGEPSYDPKLPGQGDPGQIQAWHRFGTRWRRQLDRALEPVTTLTPPPHPRREPLRAEAVRSLRDAHESLRRIPDGVGMWPTPFRTAWEARFQIASAALARTREQMVHAGTSQPEPESEEASAAPAAAAPSTGVRWDR